MFHFVNSFVFLIYILFIQFIIQSDVNIILTSNVICYTSVFKSAYDYNQSSSNLWG